MFLLAYVLLKRDNNKWFYQFTAEQMKVQDIQEG